jgi:hypothetical protein
MAGRGGKKQHREGRQSFAVWQILITLLNGFFFLRFCLLQPCKSAELFTENLKNISEDIFTLLRAKLKFIVLALMNAASNLVHIHSAIKLKLSRRWHIFDVWKLIKLLSFALFPKAFFQILIIEPRKTSTN